MNCNFEVSGVDCIHFTSRFLEYLPHLPHDTRVVYRETADLLKYLVTNIHHHRRHYTARYIVLCNSLYVGHRALYLEELGLANRGAKYMLLYCCLTSTVNI